MGKAKHLFKMFTYRLLIVAACLAGLNAAFIKRTWGTKCPTVTTKDDLEIEKYLGTWYEITKLPNIFQGSMYCVSADYTPRDEGGINVSNNGFNADGSPSGIEGYAVQSDPEHLGSLDLFFPPVRVEITRFWIQTMTSSPLSIRAVTWASSRLNSAGCWHEPRPSATKLWPRPRLFSIATESISVNSSQHLKKTATIELNIEKFTFILLLFFSPYNAAFIHVIMILYTVYLTILN